MTETKKAKVTTIQLTPDFKIEGLELPDGSFAVATAQIARILGLNYKNVSRSIKRKLNLKINLPKIKTELNSNPATIITLKQFKEYVTNIAFNDGNKKAIQIYNNLNPDTPIKMKSNKTKKSNKNKKSNKTRKSNKNKKSNKTRKSLEKSIQIQYAKDCNGTTEVPCKNGIIDILTDNKIIEVKNVRLWKHAVGQIMMYSLEFPDKRKEIFLYGEASEDFKEMIYNYCKKVSIEVKFK